MSATDCVSAMLFSSPFLGSKIWVPHSLSLTPDENDLKAICFVCNIERFPADQKGIGFDKHVKLEHYPKVSSRLQNKRTVNMRARGMWMCVGAGGRRSSSLDSDRMPTARINVPVVFVFPPLSAAKAAHESHWSRAICEKSCVA